MASGKKPGRPGAVRRTSKGPKVGSGGQGRQALEGRGPTPKAEDRQYHPAAKAKAARERRNATADTGPRSSRARRDESEFVSGRNSVVEALRAGIPATALYIAARIEYDDRVKEAVSIAGERNIPLLEVMRPELDRLAGFDGVHQGLVLKVPPYEYSHVDDLVFAARGAGRTPLLVALDGVTDPRNLGAIIRSAAAFGADGVIVPQRRAAGVTASAWKTSAGAAARMPVAMATNLTQALKSLKERGLFVIGLDGGGDVALPGLDIATRPLVVVVGSEGNGLSRLVASTCDEIVSIPIGADTESLNASVAASVALYEIAVRRAARAHR